MNTTVPFLRFLSACLPRLGSESPAGEAAADTYLMRYLAELVYEDVEVITCGGTVKLVGSSRCTRRVDVWNLRKGTRRRGPKLPFDMLSFGPALRVGDRVCVIGHTRMLSLRVSPRIEGEWEVVRPEMPDCYVLGYGVPDPDRDRIYVFYDPDAIENLGRCMVYSASAGAWFTDEARVPNMIHPRDEFIVVPVGHLLVLVGGYNFAQLQTVDVLDTRENAWRSLPDLPFPTSRKRCAAVLVGKSTIWVIGRGHAVHLDVLQEGAAWIEATNCIVPPISVSSAAHVDGKVHLFGPGDYFNVVIDLETGEWSDGAIRIEKKLDVRRPAVCVL